ncbi:hypothetical protein GGH13_003259, partial [Coemansia sp. S155-1]
MPFAITGTKDDEKIGAQELHPGASGNEPQQQKQRMHGLLTDNLPRSSSLLIHAAFKVFTWTKTNIFAEPREMPATAADQTLASIPSKWRPKYHAFELRTKSDADREPPVCLKRFDDSTKRLDRDTFMEVGKLVGKRRSEVEWEKQRPKWTLDNIERYSLFK